LKSKIKTASKTPPKIDNFVHFALKGSSEHCSKQRHPYCHPL
jgi:hypothetical protein